MLLNLTIFVMFKYIMLGLFVLFVIYIAYEIKHAPLMDEDENGNLTYHENKKSK